MVDKKAFLEFSIPWTVGDRGWNPEFYSLGSLEIKCTFVSKINYVCLNSFTRICLRDSKYSFEITKLILENLWLIAFN